MAQERGRRASVLVRLRRHTTGKRAVPGQQNQQTRISFQLETRDYCIICLTETWLSAEIPNEAIEPAGFSVQCEERTKDLSGKGKGVGVCFMINNAWCDQWNVRFIESFCSPDLEYLIISCIALWLLREISGAIVTIVYMPPQADTDLVLGKLYEAVKSPEAATIAVGDFNKAKFRDLAPKLAL
ncbi:hypothetical protein MHYP_G00308130 [Metynnis hypsauchen]